MSIIHVNQIKSRIATLFTGLIDLSDVDKGKLSDKDKESHFLTRALAAYAIHVAAHVEPSVRGSPVCIVLSIQLLNPHIVDSTHDGVLGDQLKAVPARSAAACMIH